MEKTNRVAISCVFSNPQHARTTPRGLELIYLKELLEKEFNKEVIIFGNKCRTNKDLDFFYDISEIFTHDFDSIILQLAPANFFGGKLGSYTKEAIECLGLLYDSTFDLKWSILPTDPRIKPVNPASVVNDRFELCGIYIDSWDNIISDATYLFGGKDLNRFWGDEVKRKVFKFNWFPYIFKQGVEKSRYIPFSEKIHDVIYYGDKRGSYRHNKIKKFMPDNTDNLLLGYKDDKMTHCKFHKKVKHSELMPWIDSSKVSLVIGDKEHEDNIPTFRLFEALASSALAAIDIDFDPNMELIQDEELRQLLYVKNANDVENLADNYCIELISKQRKELHRLLNQKIC